MAPLLLAATVVACGGEPESEAIPQDPNITQVERTPLTDMDFAGLDSGNVAMELPWTANRVARDPGPSAPATITNVATSGTEGFDRVVFSLETPNGFPGYQVLHLPPGEGVTCEGQPAPVTVEGERRLLIRVHPARGTTESGTRHLRPGSTDLGLDRFGSGGVVCDDGRAVVWAVELREGSDVRVLEMRNPPRLVVDVH